MISLSLSMAHQQVLPILRFVVHRNVAEYQFPPGYHATTPDTFAAAMHSVLTLSTSEELALRQRARTWAVQKFSEEEFEKGWNATGWRTWLPQ